MHQPLNVHKVVNKEEYEKLHHCKATLHYEGRAIPRLYDDPGVHVLSCHVDRTEGEYCHIQGG